MLQVDEPDDYVLATNETHPVREFVERAFAFIGITIEWQGEFGTVNEIGMYNITILLSIHPSLQYPRYKYPFFSLPPLSQAAVSFLSTVSVFL